MEVKEQRAEVAIDFPRDFRSETDPARLGKKDPAGAVRLRRDGLQTRAVIGSSPQSLGPALDRQAGFTAARPAVNW
jgi:hypothetical protein